MPDLRASTTVEPKEVIAYREDVWTWVYFDQIDQVLRYEAYVLDYDDSGSPQTLRLLLEEGLVSQAEARDSGLADLIPLETDDRYHHFPLWPHIGVNKTSLYLVQAGNIYQRLNKEQLSQLHQCFARLEQRLKKRHKNRWKKRLRLLGYDVIDSAF